MSVVKLYKRNMHVIDKNEMALMICALHPKTSATVQNVPDPYRETAVFVNRYRVSNKDTAYHNRRRIDV